MDTKSVPAKIAIYQLIIYTLPSIRFLALLVMVFSTHVIAKISNGDEQKLSSLVLIELN